MQKRINRELQDLVMQGMPGTLRKGLRRTRKTVLPEWKEAVRGCGRDPGIVVSSVLTGNITALANSLKPRPHPMMGEKILGRKKERHQQKGLFDEVTVRKQLHRSKKTGDWFISSLLSLVSNHLGII